MQSTTFSYATVRFETPARVCPGEPFSVHFVLDNDTPVDLDACSLLLKFSRCAPLFDTVFLDGIAVAGDSLRRADDGLLLRTPPLRSQERFDVQLHAVAPLPFMEDSIEVAYELGVPGERIADRRTIETPRTVAFEDRFCGMSVDGDKEIANGEARRVRFRLRNTGSTIARDVAIDLRCTGFRVDRLEQAGTLLPGERRDLEAIIVADGKRKSLSIAPVLTWADGSRDFGTTLFQQVPDSAFERGTSTLRFVSDQPLSPRGGVFDIAVSLKNIGKRPAIAPVFQLDLPPGIDLLAGDDVSAADSTIPFPDIPGGETRERVVRLKARAMEDIVIRGYVAEFAFEPLTVPVATVHSLAVSRVVSEEEGVVGEPVPVVLDLVNDGNGTLEFAHLSIKHASPHLRYAPGSLTVNGATTPDARFQREGVLGFRRVQPGALMSIGFSFDATRPTLHGQRAALSLHLRWPAGERTIDIAPMTIRPAQTDIGAMFELDNGDPIVDTSVGFKDASAETLQRGPIIESHGEIRDAAAASAIVDSAAPNVSASPPPTVKGLPDLGPVNGGITYLSADMDQAPAAAEHAPSETAHEGEPPRGTSSVEAITDWDEVVTNLRDLRHDSMTAGQLDIIVGVMLPRSLVDDEYGRASTAWANDVHSSDAAAYDPATYMLSEETVSTIVAAAGTSSLSDAIEHFTPTITSAYADELRPKIAAFLSAVARVHRGEGAATAELDDLLAVHA